MKAAHNGNLRVKVKERCLVEVKIYGNSPSMLFPRIKEKMVINIIVGLELLVAKRILNSEFNFLNRLFIRIKFNLGRGQ